MAYRTGLHLQQEPPILAFSLSPTHWCWKQITQHMQQIRAHLCFQTFFSFFSMVVGDKVNPLLTYLGIMMISMNFVCFYFHFILSGQHQMLARLSNMQLKVELFEFTNDKPTWKHCLHCWHSLWTKKTTSGRRTFLRSGWVTQVKILWPFWRPTADNNPRRQPAVGAGGERSCASETKIGDQWF